MSGAAMACVATSSRLSLPNAQLYLSCNNIGDAGTAELAKALQSNNTLTHVCQRFSIEAGLDATVHGWMVDCPPRTALPY